MSITILLAFIGVIVLFLVLLLIMANQYDSETNAVRADLDTLAKRLEAHFVTHDAELDEWPWEMEALKKRLAELAKRIEALEKERAA